MTENRETLKGHFTKNAIPTEAHFAALIDAQLNQAEDGIFKDANQPLSLRPSGALAALRVQPSTDLLATGDWSLFLTDPAAGTKPDLSIVDNDSNTHLLIDANNGSVGIPGSVAVGKAQPSASVTLDVVGKVVASGGVDAGTRLAVQKTVIGYAWSTLDTSTGDLCVFGNVGVGTTAPGTKLDVVGTTRTGTLGVGTTPAGGLAMHVNGNAGVSGFLGVGTTSPTERLDVVGKIKASNGATLTGLTTSTTLGVGVASLATGMNMHVAGNAHVSNYLGIGVATATPSVALEVNGISNTTFLQVTNYAYVANNLSVGQDGVIPGVKLYVNGKTNTQGLDCGGNAWVTSKLAVGIDPTDPSVTQSFHVAGGAEFRQSSGNLLSVKSDTGNADLKLIPGDSRYPQLWFYTNAAATQGSFVKGQPGLVNGINGNLLTLGHIDGSPFKLSVDGEVEGLWIRGGLGTFTSTLSAYSITSTTNVSATQKIYVGSWNLSVSGTTLIVSYGSTKYAAFSATAGAHRFEVQGTANYFYVAENGTYGYSAGTGPLLV